MKTFYNLLPTAVFFDSGAGGLNFLAESVKRIRGVNFAYFSDSENFPYGSKSEKEIAGLVLKAFKKVSRLQPSAAVIACNTATAVAIGALREEYSFPIIGVQPAVKPAALNSDGVAVLATPATCQSSSLKKLIDSYGRGVTKAVPCPSLAACIEKNLPEIDEAAVLNLLPDITPHAVVLGCTHYTFIKEIVEKRYKCVVYDGVEGTVNNLKNKLSSRITSFEAGKIAFYGADKFRNSQIFVKIMQTNV